MKKNTILLYDNHFNSNSKIGIWSDHNESNYWLSYQRRQWPNLNIRRRKISDIINSSLPEEAWLKEQIMTEFNKKIDL